MDALPAKVAVNASKIDATKGGSCSETCTADSSGLEVWEIEMVTNEACISQVKATKHEIAVFPSPKKNHYH